jgi:glycosyltransferase involved in cell wall biosynthesis
MRIAFVADPTHPNTDRWARHLALGLSHDVTVLATKPAPPMSSAPYAVRRVPARGKLGYVLLGWQLRSHLRLIRPELVIGYRIQSNGLAAALTGFHPLVLAAQTESIVWPPDSRLYRRTTRWAIRRADLLQAWGGHMAERLVELGASRERILVLPRGVDTTTFTPPSGPVTTDVLIVTRALRAVYRHDLLLAAFAVVVARRPGARLLIAGDGDERPRLTALATSLGLDSAVEFLGRLDERGLAGRLREAAVYVTVVAQEGVSSSLLEAMACGLAPVVPDLPGNREWVEDRVNGRLIPSAALDRPEAIADVLEAALRDAALRASCHRDNPGRVRRDADWVTNMNRMDAKYRELVERA